MANKPTYTNAYVNFPTGRLTLEEIQQIFNTIPFEIDLIDHTDHFAYFSDKPNREHVRKVEQVGEAVEECHPPFALPIVTKIINSFKDGSKDFYAIPLMMGGHRSFIQYYALRDTDGHYLGTIEFTGSAEPILQAFENGAWSNDGTSSASKADGVSGASAHDASEAVGEQAKGEAKAETATDAPEGLDATTSASKHD